MDINYRSKPKIIAAAGNLIKYNTERFDKDFAAARYGHGEVVFKTLTDRKTNWTIFPIRLLVLRPPALIRPGLLY